MKSIAEYNAVKHFEKVNKRIQTELGDPVFPSWEEALEDWQGRVKYCPPRTFMFVIDIKQQSRTVLRSGLSLLGYAENWEFTAQEFTNLMHENHRKLILYQTLCLYEIFFDFPEYIKGKGVVYCTKRGIKDAAGKNCLVAQLGTPFQYDANGRMVEW